MGSHKAFSILIMIRIMQAHKPMFRTLLRRIWLWWFCVSCFPSMDLILFVEALSLFCACEALAHIFVGSDYILELVLQCPFCFFTIEIYESRDFWRFSFPYL